MNTPANHINTTSAPGARREDGRRWTVLFIGDHGKVIAFKRVKIVLALAGAVFLLSLAAVFLVPVMVFQTMALGMIISVIAVALAALTLLPAVLIAMGDKVLVTRGEKDPDIVAEGRCRMSRRRVAGIIRSLLQRQE